MKKKKRLNQYQAPNRRRGYEFYLYYCFKCERDNAPEYVWMGTCFNCGWTQRIK